MSTRYNVAHIDGVGCTYVIEQTWDGTTLAYDVVTIPSGPVQASSNTTTEAGLSWLDAMAFVANDVERDQAANDGAVPAHELIVSDVG